jgi:hypothetical protein
MRSSWPKAGRAASRLAAAISRVAGFKARLLFIVRFEYKGFAVKISPLYLLLSD